MTDSPQETAARALLATLYPDYNERWNVEVTQSGITFCDGYHEKGVRCEHDPISIRKKSTDVYKHKKRGSIYQDLGDGILQVEDDVILKDGDALKAYIDKENRLWFRTPEEFHDGRFEQLVDVTTSKNEDIVPVQTAGLATFIPKTNAELINLVKEAVARVKALPTEEQEKMWAAQRKSWSSGPHGPTDGMGTVAYPVSPEIDRSMQQTMRMSLETVTYLDRNGPIPVQDGTTGAYSVSDFRKAEDQRHVLLSACWRAHRKWLNPHYVDNGAQIPKSRTDLIAYYSIYLDTILESYRSLSVGDDPIALS